MKIQALRARMNVVSLCLLILAVISGLSTICLILLGWLLAISLYPAVELLVLPFKKESYVFCVRCDTFSFRKVLIDNIKKTNALKNIALLSKSDAADLPAADSLLRASHPEQQGNELLRPADSSANNGPEVLLRAM